VRALAQTLDGYLWIGTSKGLVRFDGVKFVTIRFSEKEEFYSKEIRQLLVDRRGALWIGTADGLTLYPSRQEHFKSFTTANGIMGDGIRRIKDDTLGNTWISFTSSYVSRFSDGKFTDYNTAQGLMGKKVNAIVEDNQGNLLFGTRENGIFKYKDGEFSQYPVPGLDKSLIIDMYIDAGGDLWIGSEKGLFRLTDITHSTGQDIQRFSSGDGLSNDFITCITEDSDNNLWIGTAQGLNRVKRKPDGSVEFETLLASVPINCLLEDREKSLWIGTDNSGLKRLKDGKFMPYTPFETHPEESPLSLFEDRHGDTWIGTVSGKLFRCQADGISESTGFKELSGTGIASIAEDANGNLWLGTIGQGVFQKKNNHLVSYTTRNGLADNVVTSIFRDTQGNLWFSTFDGVSVLRSGSGLIESLNSREGLAGKVVYNVYESKAGDILAAADKGLTILPKVFAGGQGAVFSKRAPSSWSPKVFLPGISVTCIYEDLSDPNQGAEIFWIATEGAGLKRLNLKDDTIFSYTTAQGMATDFIYQFFEDPRGNFWLMSDSGVLRVAKSELNAIASGSGGEVTCTSFGISDGMKSLEFDNKVSRNSALKTVNNEFWFITKKGIAIVNPGKIRINQAPPPVLIEAVYFNRQSIPLHPDTGTIEFRGMVDVDFHFTAPTFLSPEKVKFKYRLEGVDPDWILLPAGQGREAHYNEIPAGTYMFRVTACNADGVWNQPGESLMFTLKSVFYQVLAFKIAMLVLILALAAAALYVFRKWTPFRNKKEKYKAAPLDLEFTGECIKKLNYLMDIKKVYCDVDLSLQSLAEKIGISPHQLSQLLNEKLDRNFFDFINEYRVEEAKRILQSSRGAQWKISAVAIEAGFNTMAAFYKAFKKHTGTTPTHYKKEIQKL
jgi:ligand-binding sensor domain-containing protein/AraC-like DNA-binding protein